MEASAGLLRVNRVLALTSLEYNYGAYLTLHVMSVMLTYLCGLRGSVSECTEGSVRPWVDIVRYFDCYVCIMDRTPAILQLLVFSIVH